VRGEEITGEGGGEGGRKGVESNQVPLQLLIYILDLKLMGRKPDSVERGLDIRYTERSIWIFNTDRLNLSVLVWHLIYVQFIHKGRAVNTVHIELATTRVF
jgi:hypothetical protein